MYLEINQKPFSCQNCPKASCNSCDTQGCVSCSSGYYRAVLSKFDRVSYYCGECSKKCRTCENKPDDCVSCDEYYVLNSSNRCVFKYTKIAIILIILVILVAGLFFYLCAYVLCKEEKPVIRVTRYGSILERDPDLVRDNLVYSAQTIGLNDESAISEVAPLDNDYLNASQISKEDVLRKMTHMIPGDPNINLEIEEEFRDSDVHSDWIPVSEPNRSNHSKTMSFKFDKTRNPAKTNLDSKKRATFFRG